MASCKVCLLSFKKNQFRVVCQECKCEFHGKCVKMTQADMDYLNEQGSLWRCDPCNATRRKSMRLEYCQAEGGVTLDIVMETLREIQEEQKKNVAEFNKSYEILYSKLDDNTQTLKSGMDKIEDYVREIDALKSENGVLKTKVVALESRVEELENYSRRSCMEIQGVPEDGAENVVEVVKKVGKALNVNIDDSMIDACHRVGNRAERSRPRGIIVKFVRRTDKEALMNRRRERKQDFSTRHLGMNTDTPIYLNDSLSPTRRKLLAQARQIKRDLGYKYIWLRNGNILLRKEEGSSVVEIRTQADLSKL